MSIPAIRTLAPIRLFLFLDELFQEFILQKPEKSRAGPRFSPTTLQSHQQVLPSSIVARHRKTRVALIHQQGRVKEHERDISQHQKMHPRGENLPEGQPPGGQSRLQGWGPNLIKDDSPMLESMIGCSDCRAERLPTNLALVATTLSPSSLVKAVANDGSSVAFSGWRVVPVWTAETLHGSWTLSTLELMVAY
jgi:hypothetical protein